MESFHACVAGERGRLLLDAREELPVNVTYGHVQGDVDACCFQLLILPHFRFPMCNFAAQSRQSEAALSFRDVK